MTHALRIGDRTGIVVAAACGLHCATAPLIAVSMQAALVAERFELMLLTSSLLLSGAIVAAHCLRRGASRAVWGTFLAGAVLLFVPFALAVPEPMEPVVGVAGAGLVVTAHVLRLARCRCRKEGPICVDTARSLPWPRC
jgi:hypothetical protein